MTQPTRQPVTEYVLDSELIVTVRSRMPGSVAIGMCSPRVEDVLVDLVGEGERRRARRHSAAISLELGAREDLAGRVVRRVERRSPASAA